MDLIILHYWGWDRNKRHNYNYALGNHALYKLAEAMIARMSVAQQRNMWWKRMAFRFYFNGYKRTAHGKKYAGMYAENVQAYIWSYAVYLCENWGYDTDELEKDWMYCIHDMRQYK